MSRPPLLRWFGWSAVAHLALGFAVWMVLPRVTPASFPASDAAVTLVALVDAPAPKDSPATPNSPGPTLTARHSLPPLKKGGAGDLPPGQAGPQAVDAMDNSDDSFLVPLPESSLSTQDLAQPEPTASRLNDSPSPPDDANGLRLPSPVSVHASEGLSNAGTATDSYRPLVLAVLERAKRYPLVAKHWGIEGAVGIAFTIHVDGRLSDPELIASSTDRVLDNAALALVRRVGYVPPPPTQAAMRFSALIQYQIDR